MTVFKKYNGSDWEAIAVGQKGDSGVGVPTGGTTDQVLAKVSATDYDTAWVTLNYVDAAGAVSAIKADADWNATDWDTAYGWGDHAVAGYALSSSLGTIASQDADSVNIDGGAIDATDIGVATPATVSSDNYLTADNYPTIKPSLNLDFANTKTLDPRVTFARASTATYYDGQTVAKAEENLVKESENVFFGSAWAINQGNTVTTSAITAPNGTNTGALNEDAQAAQTVAFVSSKSYTWSCFVKKSVSSWVRIRFGDANNKSAWFDLDTQTWGTVDSGLTEGYESAGNGWYRIWITLDSSASGNLGVAIGGCSANNDAPSTGEDVYLWGAQLELRDSVTAYTPTTTQPITNYIPVLQTASSGDPRFDHDPITGESKGLLIEEQRTNLLQRSEEFDNAYWTKTNATVTSNTVVAPNGTLTGDKLVESIDSATHFLRRGPISTANPVASVYLKAGERTQAWIFCNGPGKGAGINLLNGTVTNLSGFTNSLNINISSAGNGWYRLSFSESVSSADFQIGVANNGSISYAGDGYSGIYIWGAQLEAGSFPTSYIKTEGSQVTRVADSASMTGTNFSDWYRQDEGTLYAESMTMAAASVVPAEIHDGTFNNRIRFFRASNGVITFRNTVNGVLNFNESALGTVPINTFYKGVIAYKTDDFAGSYNGGTVVTDTSGVPAVVNELGIGQDYTGTSPLLSGTIKRLVYYPQRLSNATLQALTEE